MNERMKKQQQKTWIWFSIPNMDFNLEQPKTKTKNNVCNISKQKKILSINQWYPNFFAYTVQFGIRVFFSCLPPFRNLSFFSPHHEYISIDRSIDWSFDVMSMNSEKFIFFFFKCPQQWNWIKRKMKFHCSNFRVFNLGYSNKKEVTVIIIIILNVDSRYSNWCYLFYLENFINNKQQTTTKSVSHQVSKNNNKTRILMMIERFFLFSLMFFILLS